MDQPQRWLKYVDAGDLDGTAVDFDGMDVESPMGEHLGDVDGFIVDSDTGRPYYVVVEAGGWFKSKHFLLPVGHTRLDVSDDGETFVAELTRERVELFPGFDKDQFNKLSAEELKQINDQICVACDVSTTAVSYDDTEPFSAAWNRPSYRYPNWWSAPPPNPDRTSDLASSGAAFRDAKSSDVKRDRAADVSDAAREQQTSRTTGDESPHFGGRAQPGDILGIETAGEQTHVGETSEDEDNRRETAQKAAAKEKKQEPAVTRH